jgi:hypothetical protein
MSGERITRANVDARCANVNRRMASRGSVYRYAVEGRNGGIGLDRCYADSPDNAVPGSTIVSTVTFGTKREIADFLHAMMVALDDAAVSA